MKNFTKIAALPTLLCSTFLTTQLMAQDVDCRLIDGVLPDGCERPDAGLVVEMPAPPSSELAVDPIEDDAGFVIVIDGEPVNEDPGVEDQMRIADRALADADIQVKFDGLDAPRRLALSYDLQGRDGLAGQPIVVRSHVNYPAYVKRAEFVVYAKRGGRLAPVSRIPVDANGVAQFNLPAGEDLHITHRVYDARGRFDETTGLSLEDVDARNHSEHEEGVDMAVRRGIPAKGGSITVAGNNVRPGAKVNTLDETVTVAPDGSFVIQRVLPAGTYDVDVVVNDPAQRVDITRQVEVPGSDWFYIGTADVTLGYRTGDTVDGDETFTRGRVQLYAKGTTESGYKITAALDTRENELDELFKDLGARDPRTLFDRLDDDGYPVFGDDSSFEETAPTSGKLFLKIERDGSYAIWGNTKSNIDGGHYLRNERTLYGASARWQSQDTTERGDARAQVSVYAAQTENLQQRDVFQGTGGSVYFLSRNDIARGSETVTVQIRDRGTGRIVSTQSLAYGSDYTINYFQGTVVLTRPLTGSTSTGLVSDPTGDAEVTLVVNYEFTPTGTTADDYVFGGRAEAWVSEDLRFGVTATTDRTGIADQKAVSVDLRYVLGDNSFIDLEFARSSGPGAGARESLDGGLIFDTTSSAGGSGSAYRLDGALDFEDLELARPGTLSFYAERREAGFSTLDYTVSTDERLFGFALDTEVSDQLKLTFSYDDFKNDAGREDREAYLGLDYALNSVSNLGFGLEHIDKAGTSVTGNRTDAALRYTRKLSGTSEVYVFGQATLSRSGLAANNRVGVGGTIGWGEGWSLEGEVSDGNLGTAAKARISHNPDSNRSTYFGYELDPARGFDGLGAPTTPQERSFFVAGGQRKINERVSVFGENSYDLFGQQRSLTSTYGVEYRANNYLAYSAGIEFGDVEDDLTDNFQRRGLSLRVSYDDGTALLTDARLEWREDDGVTANSIRDSETYALTANARYKIDETRRLLFSLDAVTTNNSQSTALDGDYLDMSLGYAFRPIDNDRLNLLFKYRYLSDEFGQRIDGTDTLGAQQRSQVFSVDATYDLNEQWTIGGKLGARLSESRTLETDPYTGNDAWLGVLNARYHVTHKWDLLGEVRMLDATDAGTQDIGFLAAGYRHIGNNWKVGLGYNFGRFSDDLTDLTLDDEGLFLNIIAKY
ncbi:MAG: hypothetical protein OXC60_07735 [Litoreibacter sp.]|nr:hypothetical protein [Litoreibacter sp.]